MNPLKEQARRLKPIIQIGKNGITENLVLEIEKLLKKRKLIKIKILNNCPLEKHDDIVAFIVDRTKSELVLKMGNVFVLFRKSSRQT